MTWNELVDRVVLQFGTNPHNKAIARKFLEEGEKDLAYYTKCFTKDQSLIINQLDNYFDLPADFLEFESSIQFNDRVLSPYRDQINRIDSNGENTKGDPKYFLLTNNQIILVPHPSTDGVVNFQYLAQPVSASAGQTYYKMNYKSLDNGFFQKGSVIKGNTTGTVATVHQDENDLKRGVLTFIVTTMGSVSDGGMGYVSSNFIQDETIYTFDDDYNLVKGNQSFSQLSVKWDEYGLGARAVAGSNAYEYSDPDLNSPVIPSPYHIFLVDYAKSCLAENEKDFELADRFMKRYYQNRENVRAQISGKGTGSGTMIVADVTFRSDVV